MLELPNWSLRGLLRTCFPFGDLKMILRMKSYLLCAFIWTKMEFKALLMAPQSGGVMIGFLASLCREIEKLVLNSSSIKQQGQVTGLPKLLSVVASLPVMASSTHSFVTCPAMMSHQTITLVKKSVFPKDMKWMSTFVWSFLSEALWVVSIQKAL